MKQLSFFHFTLKKFSLQDGRTKAVEQFKSGQIPLLVATDVAARGLDIPGGVQRSLLTH